MGYWVKSKYIKSGKHGGNWSKYGGGRREDPTSASWVCQSCGKEQWQLPQHMMALDENENDFAKICALCRFRSKENNVTFFEHLTIIIRKPMGTDFGLNLANLLTIPLR